MMKCALTLFIFMASFAASAGDSPTESTVTGNVKEVILKTYKLRTKPYQLTDKNQPIDTSVSKYNEKHQLVAYMRKIDITGGADIGKEKDDSYWLVEIDKIINYDENGYPITDKATSNSYDEEGRIISSVVKSEYEKTVKKYTYKENQKIIETLEFKNGNLTPTTGEFAPPKETITYDKSGRIERFDYDCEGCVDITYEYNEQGFVSKESFYRYDKLDHEVIFKYPKIDEHGNWLERLDILTSHVSNNETAQMVVRQISYRD
ncbi:MAG: hypothetical protein HWE16_08550 [Gammaproteobacteria bacterium]|nr:hypothetical protein [Gammaproteobacteria bacterium]